MKKYLYIVNSFKSNGCNLIHWRYLILIFVFYTTFTRHSFSQNDTVNVEINAEVEIMADSTEVLKIEEPGDTTVVKLKNKILLFIEYDEKLVVDRIDLKTGEKKRVLDIGDKNYEPKKDRNKFRGHWSGIEFGINDLANSSYSIDRPAGYEYLDFRTGRSWNVNINFSQSSLSIINNRVGIVGGLGLEMNNYYFKNNNNIQKNETSEQIEKRNLDQYEVRRSKFTTTYLITPIIIEAQFGKGKSKERFYISGGVVGGLKISSATKVVHEVNGKKEKLKERGKDLNINRWRIGLTARIGFKDSFNFYANYYFTPLFEKDQGPELHPFAIGIRTNF